MTPVSVLYHCVRNHIRTVTSNSNHVITLMTGLLWAALLCLKSSWGCGHLGVMRLEHPSCLSQRTGAFVETARRLGTAGTLGQLGGLSPSAVSKAFPFSHGLSTRSLHVVSQAE